MYAGQMVAYRIRLLPGIRVRWLTEIPHVREGTYFVDEQRVGPYKIWHHEHHFITRDGGTEMTDHVTRTPYPSRHLANRSTCSG